MITSALLRTETERWREEYTLSRPARSYRWVLGRLGMTACRLSVCLRYLNRCSKDSCCAQKGLVTNWPHHSILAIYLPKEKDVYMYTRSISSPRHLDV